MKKLALSIASAALAVSAFAALPAQAADGVKVGMLTCREQASWGFIVGSSRRLNCRFDPNNGKKAPTVETVTRRQIRWLATGPRP